jgi:ribosomal protein S24E
MDFTVTKEENKPLLHRRDVSARIAFEASTPSRQEIRKAAATALKAKEDFILITRILPSVGSPSANVDIRIYDDEKAFKDVEHNFTLVRHGLAGKKGKATTASK